MPYGEDGETWDGDYRQHFEGMAENQPGHKKFADYNLPRWTKHPLTHPFSGVFIDAADFAYSAMKPESGTSLDGVGNHHGWGPAHIAARFGDMEMLEVCTDAQLSQPTHSGDTPAHYAVEVGHAWVLQWLYERGADTTSANNLGYTPEELIWVNSRNHSVEMEWLEQAIKGELVDKKLLQSQEYKLKRWQPEGMDPVVAGFLEKNKELQRKFMYKAGDYPSPYIIPGDDEVRERQDLPSSLVRRPAPKGKPAMPAALLFPGQGSQYVGMLKGCADLPAVQAMLAKAKDILGWDVRQLCLEGPEEQLGQTKYCQPCMFIAGMAGLEIMRESKNEAVDRPQAVAGLSLGEYTALCAAGVLSFEDALRLVKVRAEAMQEAAELTPQCMCSVAGLDKTTVQNLCKEAIKQDKETKDPVCQIANILFPGGFVCAGTKKTVEKLTELALEQRAMQARVIKAGGAFHTPLMKPAEEELKRAVDSAKSRMNPPRCAIYFNVTGKKVLAGTDPAEFVGFIKSQLTSEVQWEPSVRQMVMDGVKDFYEVGPLKQIKAMIKRIDQDAFKRTENIAV